MPQTLTIPDTRYASSGEASIAYQVIGEGPIDLMFMPGWISQVEQLWESPGMRRWLESLSTFARVILYDRRGTGLSDRAGAKYELEQDTEDAIAVLDAVESERVALCTYAVGGQIGVLLAADHPDRIGALMMFAPMLRTLWAPDYDWALTREQREELIERNVATWGQSGLWVFEPSAREDQDLVEWFARLQRLAASPGEARAIYRATMEIDVRDALPRVRVPTLVLHRPNELVVDVRHSRYAAAHIPNARYVELEGSNSLPFLGDTTAIVEEMKEFLTGERSRAVTRALLTVMFTDIVDSTGRASLLGDARWRDLLARHDQVLRRELVHFGGRAVKSIGDGVLAVFDGTPSPALRCALAIARQMRSLGLDVRVGMHTGECELVGEDVAGMAVHIAARVNGLAQPGEVLVSGTVFGTVVGGPFSFQSRGSHALKGVPGQWPIFALA
ncbi:MAG TPA: adenylate/guanylate cyclase domain-containing protein [Solirubrobacteraceae bacterium]|nr:adenylate/guanylate cyclase domain-containing protein [Solirubrobacteraceae bacterium]